MTRKRLYLKLIAVLAILMTITGCTADSQVRKTPIAGWCDDSSGIVIPEDVSCYFENAAPLKKLLISPKASSHCQSLGIIGILFRQFGATF